MHDVFMTTTAIEKLGNFPVLPEPTYFSPLTIQWIVSIQGITLWGRLQT